MAELWWIMGENKFKKWHLNLSRIFCEKFLPLWLELSLNFKRFLQHQFKLLLIIWGFLHVLAVTRLSGPLLCVRSKRARCTVHPNDDHPEGGGATLPKEDIFEI